MKGNPMHHLSSLLFVLAVAASAAAEDFQVPFSVEEPAGVARTAEPVSGGLPLPRGRFPASQQFALFRADGTELPVQVSPLVVETDGSLRWVLLDFQDDLPARGKKSYVLKAVAPTVTPAVGPAASPLAITVADTPEAVTIDTGRMVLVVSRKKPFALLDSVTLGGTMVAAGQHVAYEQMFGRAGWNDPAPWQVRRFEAAPPETVTLHYAGPLRVTVEVVGHFADDPLKAGYRAWITTWAGSTRTWVKYALVNSNPDERTVLPVKRSMIELATPAADGTTLLGTTGAPLEAKGRAWLHQGLRFFQADQDILGAAKAGSGDQVLWTGNGRQGRPAGWIAARGPSTVYACDELFVNNPARRLEAGDGSLTLLGIAERFEGDPDRVNHRPRLLGQPWKAPCFWLQDCSHHTSQYLLDFAAPTDVAALAALATAARSRLWALAPGEVYSREEVTATGRFGTLDDEIASYRRWGWTFADKLLPNKREIVPGGFVGSVDNHGDSEGDSPEALLLMYLRTGQRGWFDLGEAWARYHMDLQAWRTDGWTWDDGAIWYPGGGALGTEPRRANFKFRWGANWNERENSPDCIDLWLAQCSKSCTCHFYGAGLADYFCLTGDRDALLAALDNAETKDSEYRKHLNLVPGKSRVTSIRSFGRALNANVRVLQADPGNKMLRNLCRLLAETLRRSSMLDERGFHALAIGGNAESYALKDVSPKVRAWMADRGMKPIGGPAESIDSVTQGDQTWKVVTYGGTWEHVYIQWGADQYARYFGDENLADLAVAYGQMAAKFLLSKKCHEVAYIACFDVTERGNIFDPWIIDHAETTDGLGCKHSGYFARFYADVCARAYSRTGDPALLDKAREFWYYGSKRQYLTTHLTGGPNEVAIFASHSPPKDDEVLSTSRMFYEASHPRTDAAPPAAVADLKVRRNADGQIVVTFTAPADVGGGRVARYQLKVADLPIVSYDQWDFVRDMGVKRNWWRALNVGGEPAPSAPGTVEQFTPTDLPSLKPMHFVVRSCDDSGNLSAVSNVATVE